MSDVNCNQLIDYFVSCISGKDTLERNKEITEYALNFFLEISTAALQIFIRHENQTIKKISLLFLDKICSAYGEDNEKIICLSQHILEKYQGLLSIVQENIDEFLGIFSKLISVIFGRNCNMFIDFFIDNVSVNERIGMTVITHIVKQSNGKTMLSDKLIECCTSDKLFCCSQIELFMELYKYIDNELFEGYFDRLFGIVQQYRSLEIRITYIKCLSELVENKSSRISNRILSILHVLIQNFSDDDELTKEVCYLVGYLINSASDISNDALCYILIFLFDAASRSIPIHEEFELEEDTLYHAAFDQLGFYYDISDETKASTLDAIIHKYSMKEENNLYVFWYFKIKLECAIGIDIDSELMHVFKTSSCENEWMVYISFKYIRYLIDKIDERYLTRVLEWINFQITRDLHKKLYRYLLRICRDVMSKFRHYDGFKTLFTVLVENIPTHPYSLEYLDFLFAIFMQEERQWVESISTKIIECCYIPRGECNIQRTYAHFFISDLAKNFLIEECIKYFFDELFDLWKTNAYLSCASKLKQSMVNYISLIDECCKKNIQSVKQISDELVGRTLDEVIKKLREPIMTFTENYGDCTPHWNKVSVDRGYIFVDHLDYTLYCCNLEILHKLLCIITRIDCPEIIHTVIQVLYVQFLCGIIVIQRFVTNLLMLIVSVKNEVYNDWIVEICMQLILNQEPTLEKCHLWTQLLLNLPRSCVNKQNQDILQLVTSKFIDYMISLINVCNENEYTKIEKKLVALLEVLCRNLPELAKLCIRTPNDSCPEGIRILVTSFFLILNYNNEDFQYMIKEVTDLISSGCDIREKVNALRAIHVVMRIDIAKREVVECVESILTGLKDCVYDTNECHDLMMLLKGICSLKYLGFPDIRSWDQFRIAINMLV